MTILNDEHPNHLGGGRLTLLNGEHPNHLGGEHLNILNDEHPYHLGGGHLTLLNGEHPNHLGVGVRQNGWSNTPIQMGCKGCSKMVGAIPQFKWGARDAAK